LQYCGTAGKPGGNRENKLHPIVGGVPSLLEIAMVDRRMAQTVQSPSGDGSYRGCRPFDQDGRIQNFRQLLSRHPTVVVGRSTKMEAAPRRERFLVCVGERDIRPGETA